MMRYIHTTSCCDFVSLTEEVDYIRQYVGLQSLRLNEMTSVNLDIDISNDSVRMPPMLLVTFVENCFKHGVSSVERTSINITINEKKGELTFSTANRIFPVKRIGEHMGIENCRKRLNLLYPHSHSLNITNDGRDFRVGLRVNLTSQ